MSPRNHAYLADFGLVHSDRHTALTEPGRLLGTPGYLAPELRCGDEATPASDVYAFSAMLHECLEATCVLPPAVTAVLERGLAVSPADRPERVRDVTAAALRALEPSAVRPAAATPAPSAGAPPDMPRRWRGWRPGWHGARGMLAATAVLAVSTLAAGRALHHATAQRFVADLARPMVGVMPQADFMREHRIARAPVGSGGPRARRGDRG